MNTSPLTLLQISDLHIFPDAADTLLGINTQYYFQQILQHAHQQQLFDMILVTGDLAQEPCQASYQRIAERLAAYHTPTICLAGNHDDWQLMQQCLTQDKISCRQQLIFQDWQLIALNSHKANSNQGHLAVSELHFLQHCLETQPTLHAMIAVHHHCIPTRSTWLDTMIIDNHAQLFAVLRDFPQVKLISTGHIHQELDATEQGIRILGTPSTCFQFKPLSHDFDVDTLSPGYRILQLYPMGDIQTQVFRLPIVLTELDNSSNGY